MYEVHHATDAALTLLHLETFLETIFLKVGKGRDFGALKGMKKIMKTMMQAGKTNQQQQRRRRNGITSRVGGAPCFEQVCIGCLYPTDDIPTAGTRNGMIGESSHGRGCSCWIN